MKKVSITSLSYRKHNSLCEICFDKNIYLTDEPSNCFPFIITSMVSALNILEELRFSIKGSGRTFSQTDECLFLAFLSKFNLPLIDINDDDDLSFFESLFPTLSQDLHVHRMEVIIEARIDSIFGIEKVSYRKISSEFKKITPPKKRKRLTTKKGIGAPAYNTGKPYPRSDG